MSLGINKMELKKTKNVISWRHKLVEEGKKEEEIDKEIELRLIEQLDSLKTKFTKEKRMMYEEEKVIKTISEKAKKKSLTLGSEKLNKLKNQIIDQKLRYYEIRELTKNDRSITFGITHEFFDIEEFREEIIPYYSTVYVSVSIQINSPYAIVFINGRYDVFPTIRSLLRDFISDDINVRAVKWEDAALRQILNDYAKEIILINAKNIEGKIVARATASDLNNSNILSHIERGSLTAVKFNFKKMYEGNDLSINGMGGWISTTLSDKDAKEFVQNYLLAISS